MPWHNLLPGWQSDSIRDARLRAAHRTGGSQCGGVGVDSPRRDAPSSSRRRSGSSQLGGGRNRSLFTASNTCRLLGLLGTAEQLHGVGTWGCCGSRTELRSRSQCHESLCPPSPREGLPAPLVSPPKTWADLRCSAHDGVFNHGHMHREQHSTLGDGAGEFLSNQNQASQQPSSCHTHVRPKPTPSPPNVNYASESLKPRQQ